MKKICKCYMRFPVIKLIPIILIVCVTASCQPTPSVQPIIGRQEDILKSAIATTFEKIRTPEHISKTYGDFPKLNIAFDADITVPEATAYPVTKVTKKAFSDDDILSYIKLLSGRNDEIYSEWNLTKEELDQKINEVIPYVKSGKVAQNWLDKLQRDYSNIRAGTKNPLVKIPDLPAGTESEVYVKNADNSVSEFFLKRHDNFFGFYRDMFLDAYAASFYADSDFDPQSDTIEHFKWMQPGEPEISQENAYSEALKYIDEMGIGLDIYSAEPCTVLINQVKKSTGWQFTFTRSISNLQAQYNDIGLMVSPFSVPSYGAPWLQEMCRVVIDKDGLCILWWQGVSEVSTVAASSVRLESFENVEQRIVNQLNYMYGTHENGTGNGLDIKITEIRLGISLISEKDKTDSGIYIPTWYVSYGLKWSDDEDTEESWEPNQVMFNALDGSYIEPRVTNEGLMEMMNMGSSEG